MIWRYIDKDKLEKIVCSNKNTNEYRIALTSNDKNIPKNNNNVRYISIFVNGRTNIHKIISNLLSLQNEYHNSLEIKRFYVNGNTYWFDNQERTSLINLFNSQKDSGLSKTTIWFNNTPIELDIDKAITLINNIEQYSSNCYNVTQQHLLEIKNITNIKNDDKANVEEQLKQCLNYDITKGYPNNLVFEIE